MNENTVIIEGRDVYGQRLIYPVNAIAKTLCSLTGHKTFTPSNLRKIEDIGFKIEWKQTPIWKGV